LRWRRGDGNRDSVLVKGVLNVREEVEQKDGNSGARLRITSCLEISLDNTLRSKAKNSLKKTLLPFHHTLHIPLSAPYKLAVCPGRGKEEGGGVRAGPSDM